MGKGKAYKTQGCTHEGTTMVLKVGKGTSLWAGAKDELLEQGGWALVISAVGFNDFTDNPLTTTPGARALLPGALFDWAPPACVGITWPDRGIPALGAAWWRELAKALPAVKGDIGVCCMGGHGRTGVMLAILAALLGKVKKGDCPVEWVRAHYCNSTVESEAQADYVERITGRKVFAEPSDALRPTPMATVWAGGAAGGVLASAAGRGRAPSMPGNAGFPGNAGPRVDVGPTGPGSGDGIVRGDNPLDEEMLDAWFKADGDVITTIDAHGKTEYSVPVWDKGGDHVGWREATAAEMAE